MAIISICRGTKSGGTAMARCLAERLDYPIVGEEILEDTAEQLGVSVDLLKEKMHEPPTVWDRFSSVRRTYVAGVQATLSERVPDGNLVYHGLSGGLLLRDVPVTLCTRLIAPMSKRVQAVMDESDMDAATAERYIRDVDAARARWVKLVYDVDIEDPSLYDLVINLESISVQGGCSIVTEVIGRSEFEVTDEVKARLQDFRLECQIRLALARNDRLRNLELDARSQNGDVVITGEVPLLTSGKMGDRIAEVARSVAGVQNVRLAVDWFDPYP